MFLKEKLTGKNFKEISKQYYLSYLIGDICETINDDDSLEDCLKKVQAAQGTIKIEEFYVRSNYGTLDNDFAYCKDEIIEQLVDAGIYALCAPIYDAIAKQYKNRPEKMYELYLRSLEAIYNNKCNRMRARYKKIKIEYNTRLLGGECDKAMISFNAATIIFAHKNKLQLKNIASLIIAMRDDLGYHLTKTDTDKLNTFLFKYARYGLVRLSKSSGSYVMKKHNTNSITEDMFFDLLETDHDTTRALFKGKFIAGRSLKNLAEKNPERFKELLSRYLNREFHSKSITEFQDAIKSIKEQLSNWWGDTTLWDNIQDFAFELDEKLQGYFIAFDLN